MQKASWLSTSRACSPLSGHVEGKWPVILTAKQSFLLAIYLVATQGIISLIFKEVTIMMAAHARPNSFISDNTFPLISQRFEQ